MFNDAYYKNIIDDFGYKDIERFNGNLGQISQEELNIRFLCHKNGDKIAKLLELEKDDKNIIVTTGFGMSGAPHMGTLSQMKRVDFLLKNNINSQIVLGDLDALNGKNKSYSYVNELTDRYFKFIDKILLNNKDKLILRNQLDSKDILLTDYLLSKFVDNKDFEHTEEDLHKFYADKGKVDSEMTFRRSRSLLLMISDFLTLFKQFDGVSVMLGVDEHKYVLLAQKLLERVKKTDDINIKNLLNIKDDSVLASVYTKLLKGLNGYPKQSKSFPDSGIILSDSEDDVRRKINLEYDNFYDKKFEDNILVNMMLDTFYLKDKEELDQFLGYFEKKDKEKIYNYIAGFIEYLNNFTRIWKEV